MVEKIVKIESVTEEQFKAYVKVQYSGKYNMFELNNVMDDSKLSRGQVLFIMENYAVLDVKYPNVLKKMNGA